MGREQVVGTAGQEHWPETRAPLPASAQSARMRTCSKPPPPTSPAQGCLTYSNISHPPPHQPLGELDPGTGEGRVPGPSTPTSCLLWLETPVRRTWPSEPQAPSHCIRTPGRGRPPSTPCRL